MIYTVVKVIGWIYVLLLPVAVLVTYFFTWVAAISGSGDVAIIAGVLVTVSFIASAWKIFMLLRKPLDGRVAYWLLVGIANWLVLLGFVLYRYFFGDCCL